MRNFTNFSRENDISSIPDILDVINQSNFNSFNFIGSQGVRNCLSGKRIIFLGDSTMTEQVHDIAILLAGIGENRNLINDYMLRVYGTRKSQSFQLMNLTLSFNVRPEHRIGQRNMTIRMGPPHNINSSSIYGNIICSNLEKKSRD